MIHVSITPTQQQLIAAHKARQQRYEVAARKVTQSQQLRLTSSAVSSRGRQIPRWSIETTSFDHHVKAFERWRIETAIIAGNPVKSYIRARCEEMGVAYQDIVAGGRKRSVVPVRDKIIYEIKTEVKPGISWGELGLIFGRDHSSTITAYYCGAMAAGDEHAAEKIGKRRRDARDRHRVLKARAA